MEALNAKLVSDVKKFLEVYRVLSSEGKAQFEAQLIAELNGLDERTKTLYQALLQAAREQRDVTEAIERMKQASQDLPANNN